jgi:hypothetical protein
MCWAASARVRFTAGVSVRKHRRFLSVMVGAVLITPALAAVAGSAAAPAASAATAQPEPTQVTVIPADPDPATTLPQDSIDFAGTTGFLHVFTAEPSYSGSSSGYLWTSYASATTTPVPGMQGDASDSFFPAGGDELAIYPAGGTSGYVTELDPATGVSSQYAIPTGFSADGLYGSYMIVAPTGANPPSYSVLSFAANGTYTTTPVTGLPAGAIVRQQDTGLDTGNGSAAILRYFSAGAYSDGLLDLATGVFTPITSSTINMAPLLTATSIAVRLTGSELAIYSLSGIMAGTDTTPELVTLPSGTDWAALAGAYVVAVDSAAGGSALAVPVSGGTSSIVVPDAQGGYEGIAQGPDGALIVGGTGMADWSVREIAADAGGNLTDSPLLPLTQMSNAGLTISQGDVWHVEGTPGFGVPDETMFSHPLVPDNTWDIPYDQPSYAMAVNDPMQCAPDAACVRVVDGNYYGPAYLGGTGDSMNLYEGDQTIEGEIFPGPATLVDASSDYVIIDVAATSSASAQQDVVDVGYAKTVSSGPVTGAGLWFDTLWRANAPGEIQASSLDSSSSSLPISTSPPISTGADCQASDVQATARWVYWACGTSGPAGVYDLQTKTEISVPSGPALLGDGYIVQQDPSTGDLIMHDVQADTASGPITLATGVPVGPGTDDRNITWAVDKYSGDVAYVDSGDNVHVIDTGVPATPVAVGEPSAAELHEQDWQSTGWSQYMYLSRPVSGWTVTITQGSTDHVVHTETGGPARYGITPTWNYLLPDGKKGFSGPYTWSLTATVQGATTPTAVASGPLGILCGQIPFRSIDCSGASALLAVQPNTEATWYVGTLSGKLVNSVGSGYTENWDVCRQHSRYCDTALIPFGDFAGKGTADLLVRTGNGEMRAYIGDGSADFYGTKSFRVPGDWNKYNALVAPGTETSGGRLELLARDDAGRLWLYLATGHGTFARRRLIGRGWNKYTRLIGAGALSSNGIGDLLAISKNGTMWRLDGNGRGGFDRPQRVSSGWNSYNVIIGIGDLTNNGDNDLVARDRHGDLWLFPGNGRGGFGRRVLLGKGWNRYQGLF